MSTVERPAALLVVVAAVGLEVLGLAVVVVAYAVGVVRSGAADDLGAVATAAVAVVAGVGLGACARALLGGRRWARSPVLTWQVLQLLIGGLSLDGALWWVRALLLASALVAAVGLFVPAVVRATRGQEVPPLV